MGQFPVPHPCQVTLITDKCDALIFFCVLLSLAPQSSDWEMKPAFHTMNQQHECVKKPVRNSLTYCQTLNTMAHYAHRCQQMISELAEKPGKKAKPAAVL